MILVAPANFSEAIAALQQAGKLPADLSPKQIALLQKSLGRYSGEVSQGVLDKIFTDYQSKIQTAQAMNAPADIRGIIADLTAATGSVEISDGIKFALQVSSEVVSGAGQYLNQNLSPEAVDEYPALEFKRLYQREIPRGEKLVKGGLVEDPQDAWDGDDGRWVAACEEAEDWDALQSFKDTGRMCALKKSGVWQALGDGAGGHTDCLGNPFPPFAFRSGYGTVNLSRKESTELNLLERGAKAEPAALDFADLFAEVGA